MLRTGFRIAGILAALVVLSASSRVLAACEPDGAGHPSVMIIFGQLTDPGTCNEQIISGCHAILVSPTVAITSAGCAAEWGSGGGFELTATWLGNNPDDLIDCAVADRIASFHPHPDFDPATNDSPFNIGVIVLAAPSTKAHASLPGAGELDLLLRGDPLDAVGYASPGGAFVNATRRATSVSLARSTESFFKVRKPGGQDSCVPGADGSAVFHPGGQDLVGMSIGSQRGWRLRLDIQAVRDFLDDFVTLP